MATGDDATGPETGSILFDGGHSVAVFRFYGVDSDGIMAVTCGGFWSAEDTLKFLGMAAEKMAQGREPGRGVRLMVDLRSAMVQSGSTAALIGSRLREMTAPEDRVALLIGSSIQKFQAQRINPAGTRMFTTEADARDWLRSQP